MQSQNERLYKSYYYNRNAGRHIPIWEIDENNFVT